MNDFRAEPEELRQQQIAAVDRVFRSGRYILGAEVELFEQRWAARCGVSQAVGVGSGMDALEIGLTALGIGSGAEVITTPLSAFASTLAILRARATPVFADIDSGTALLDVASARRCVSAKTKAVLLVHLYGRAAKMDQWIEFCQDQKLLLIEDCAQSHLSEWNGRKSGSFGAFGAFSFYPTKNLGAIGDGGALVTENAELARRARMLRNYGQSARYHHPIRGLNSRLDEIHAAILSERLQWLDRFVRRRREIANKYCADIRNPLVTLMDRPTNPESHVYHLFVLRCDRRDELATYLRERGVETLVHYPIPLHKQEPCLEVRRDSKGLTTAEFHSARCLSIPCHPQMSDADVKTVTDSINAFQ